MTAPDLRPCCQQAVLDGISPLDHYAVCDARHEDLTRNETERHGTEANTHGSA